MPSTYKTPGVYVEEVSTFPPSVAPVATAIPAFIGYTEKAIKNGASIANTPTRISSFVEFAQFFGGAPDRGIVIRLNAQNQFVSSETQSGIQQYYLYDSMRLFYDNGGGDCYIVSVGSYSDTPDIGAAAPTPTGILGGLKVLEKYDEPTLIVSPDATLLDSDMYSYQQQALAQCANLQDRFLIGDLLLNDEHQNGKTFDERVEQFRNAIGINNLKYGAVYASWVNSTLSAVLGLGNVLFHRSNDAASPNSANSQTILLSLTSSEEIRQLIHDTQAAIGATKSLEASMTPGTIGGLVGNNSTGLDDELQGLLDAAETAAAAFDGTTWTSVQTELSALYDKLIDVIAAVYDVYQGLPTLVSSITTASSSSSAKFRLSQDIDAILANAKSKFESLVTNHVENTSAITIISNVSTGSSFEAAFKLFGYSGALGTAAVDTDADTANAYDSLAAIAALYTEINTGGTLHTAIDAESNHTDAYNLLKTQLPADLAANISARIQQVINDNALNPVKQQALIKEIGDTTLIDRIAGAYIEAQSISNSNEAVSHLSDDINTIVQTILAAATTAESAAISGDGGSVIAAAIVLDSDENNRRVSLIIDSAKAGISDIFGFHAEALSAAKSYESTFNESLKGSFGLYKTLLDRADSDIMVLPPSGAMAGIYTRVDNDRGVWKAPANVSLSSVSGPNFIINSSEQENLNVDVNAGKSINAIRAFTGKGVLVWGARTLAGNDNEWRYVPVRRFFNFAEESIKKATEQFVFEPNDANTWVKIRAMIENFLTLQWRAGALAGAKPDHAFFVKIGLGETMTSADILEGRMIVEIGMAVVGPAEFIILRFSHKMQET